MPVSQICALFESRLNDKEIMFSREAGKYFYIKWGPQAVEDDDSDDEE